MVKALEKPRPLPVLPPLTELDDSETAKRNIEEWSEAIAEQKRFNDELFERGLKRMKLCAYLNGALGRSLNSHFSWCPHTDWDDYWRAQGWPALPKIPDIER